ncbi:S1C family serine protease [Granulibacter bethesdensis]|uniref:S1C family serine protease n=1 Tax=Granulibacter bethesdensis TaxID=364410 RepID=UPI0003F20C2B|nr:S1C family serine protease [Granulibacter bethesdensis]AHJ68247.1 PDZ domain family protein [Granulibacter bethesdensis]
MPLATAALAQADRRSKRQAMSEDQWQIPQNMQPHPSDYSFDLEAVLQGIVFLRCLGPDGFDPDGSDDQGAQRTGSGVAIEVGSSQTKMVITMTYLVNDADAIWITTQDGQVTPGHIIALDHESGFALIRPADALACPAIQIGDSSSVASESGAILAASGGITHAMETRIIARQEFAGYWEYHIPDALLVTPPHPVWGGCALIGMDGRLLGIAAVVLQQGDVGAGQLDINLIIPVSHLQAILPELLTHGRRLASRPWLGLLAAEQEAGILISDVVPHGPAEAAGLRQGDQIIAINGKEPGDLATLWRLLWQSGAPPVGVAITILRDGQTMHTQVQAIDRYLYDKTPRMH